MHYLLGDPVCKFKIGGLSHQSKKKLLQEPWLIQRDVLRLNIFYRLASITRRTAATDRKSTRLNSSHIPLSRMPSSA